MHTTQQTRQRTTCYGPVTELLRGNWCNGFWPFVCNSSSSTNVYHWTTSTVVERRHYQACCWHPQITTTTAGPILTRRQRPAPVLTTAQTDPRLTIVVLAVPGSPAARLPATTAGGAGISRLPSSARWQREGLGRGSVSRKTITTPVWSLYWSICHTYTYHNNLVRSRECPTILRETP